MKKILLTGASGLLGPAFIERWIGQWKIVACYHRFAAPWLKDIGYALDLSDARALDMALEEIRPDAIVHLAGMTQPNACEQDPAQSKKVNVEVSSQLAKYAAKQQIPLVFSSTDLVFDGSQAPYREIDGTNPINVYGQHKAEAEAAILAIHPLATVARLPLLYGWSTAGKGFMVNWVERLREGGVVYAFTDEYRTTVSSDDAAGGMGLLLEKQLSGIWHLGGRERMSRYDFAQEMARVFGLPGDRILPSLQKEVQMAAARPADVSLDSEKAFGMGYQARGISAELHRINAAKSNRLP
ncbi:MAG: SDR family oxidoreductase [Bacteroidota bacterium]